MDKQDVIRTLAAIIEDISLGRVSADSIDGSERIIADLRLDSLDFASVMLRCEQSTGVRLDEDRVNWAEVDTVGKLAQLFATGPRRA